ncbi:MAG: outer membrane beta-barrel protein [Candidatus Eiseniibacteriota bacterium]
MRFLKLSLCGLVAAVLFAAPASAQTTTPMSWSLYAGYANPTGELSPGGSFAFRANGFYNLSPVMGIGAEAGYHALGSITELEDAGIENSWSAIQFTPEVRARGVTGNIRPYGMVGFGVYNLRGSMDDGTTEVSDNTTEMGFNFGGGVTFGQGPTTFGLEARWHSIMTEGDATDVVGFMAGVNFN